MTAALVTWFNQLGMKDLPEVGGKNASLGEMICELSKAGVKVPNGFATTAYAYKQFLAQNNLYEQIKEKLSNLDVENVHQLAQTGAAIRQQIIDTPLLPDLEHAVRENYAHLVGHNQGSVAIRSSATAEDLPDASFAGQQETFLNIAGIDNVLLAVKQVFASLFNDRAIAYRVHKNYSHFDIALSAGIQQMVRSDLGASGVMFTLDTETGFDEVVFITSSYGLGEAVVQGLVNPDEFYVYKDGLRNNQECIINRHLGDKALMMTYTNDHRAGYSVETVNVPDDRREKFSLSDNDILILAKHAMTIEKHYGRNMDIEWAKDGLSGEIFILQARPETVNSQVNQKNITKFEFCDQFNLENAYLTSGRAIGQKIGVGKVTILQNHRDMTNFAVGDVLVTDMTDPDWEPIMAKAAAIVTNRGGRTCHAAIIARELGIPAVVGCGNATETLSPGEIVTVSCCEGETGYIYSGERDFNIQTANIDKMPAIKCNIMMNIGNPEKAFSFQNLPNAGVGLARLEFIISHVIGIHPKALLEFNKLDSNLKQEISARIVGYKSPTDFYVSKLAESIAMLGVSFKNKPVIVRLSDFKSNEYANLLGGKAYEPIEENPMLGYRGAARYTDQNFKQCFELECQAIKKVRGAMGLKNIQIMIPFVRTLKQAQEVISLLKDFGLVSGEDDLKIIMMCEIPSNVILAEEFLEYFDGFSIGSNDLTQLTLGIDRDSGLVAEGFDERDPAVIKLLEQVIKICKKKNKYIGICGQGPSDHQDFAKWLLEQKIDSISLNPDTVLQTWLHLANY
ncbi:MAG: phosphoenolpyruvate synthase [Gammaproteobacteria bacterium]|nr:phosphoenolpyruvate synthase [Gammaproteobacteria bacterium]